MAHLRRAHQSLLESDPSVTSVASIAYQWGLPTSAGSLPHTPPATTSPGRNTAAPGLSANSIEYPTCRVTSLDNYLGSEILRKTNVGQRRYWRPEFAAGTQPSLTPYPGQQVFQGGPGEAPAACNTEGEVGDVELLMHPSDTLRCCLDWTI